MNLLDRLGIRTLFFVWLLCAAALGSHTAWAEPQQGFDVQNFRPTPGPRDLLIVPQTQPLGHLSVSAGMFMDFSLDPLQLINPFDKSEGYDLIKNRLQFQLMGAIGIKDWLEVGFALPIVAFQQSSNLEVVNREGFIAPGGLPDISMFLKVPIPYIGKRSYPKEGLGMALWSRINFPACPPSNLACQVDNFLSDGTVTANPAILVDYRFPKNRLLGMLLAASVGVYARPTIVLNNAERLGPMMTFNGGVELPYHKYGLAAMAGFYANVPLTTPIDVIGCVPSEFLLGGRWYGDNGLTVSTGFNFGGGCGLGNPTFRYWLGLVYVVPKKLVKTLSLEHERIVQWKRQCPSIRTTDLRVPSGCDRIVKNGDVYEILEKVDFFTDRAEITPAAEAILQEAADLLRQELSSNARTLIIIGGHTDSRATYNLPEQNDQEKKVNDQYNIDLSRRRAKTIYDWITDPNKGKLDPARVKIKAFGRSKLIAKDFDSSGNINETAADANRRVDFTIASSSDTASLQGVEDPRQVSTPAPVVAPPTPAVAPITPAAPPARRPAPRKPRGR